MQPNVCSMEIVRIDGKVLVSEKRKQDDLEEEKQEAQWSKMNQSKSNFSKVGERVMDGTTRGGGTSRGGRNLWHSQIDSCM